MLENCQSLKAFRLPLLKTRILTLLSPATGGLLGILGYGFYTTVSGQAMNNVRAMGMRVGAQFAVVAAGLTYYAINEVGMPLEVWERYKTTGKILAHSENVQAQLAHKRHE